MNLVLDIRVRREIPRRPRLAVGAVALIALCAGCAPSAPEDAGRVLASAVPVLVTTPGPCPSSAPAGGTEIVRFNVSSGGCIREDQLEEVRCTAADDPVLVVGERRFLGGIFAVPVYRVPPGARMLGRASDTEVFAVPGDPPTVWVRTAGKVERWLTLEAPGARSQPNALFLGDSIMVASRPVIARSLPGWTLQFNARVGRPTVEGIRVASQLSGQGFDAVVIELGTNDATATGFPSLAHRLLSVVGTTPLLTWVTVHRDVSFEPEINADIHRAVGKLPNAALADWNQAVPPEGLLSDGIHPSDLGKQILARLLSTLLDRWYMATTGRGDTACAGPATQGVGILGR